MKTKVITIKGQEYTISSSSNLGLENAEIQLKNSLGINEKAMKKADTSFKLGKKKNKKQDGI